MHIAIALLLIADTVFVLFFDLALENMPQFNFGNIFLGARSSWKIDVRTTCASCSAQGALRSIAKHGGKLSMD